MQQSSFQQLISKLLEWIYLHLGKPFVKFQKGLFALFVVTAVVGIPYGILVEDRTWIEALHQTWRAVLWWMVLSAGSSAIWFLSIKLFDFDLWLFYYFWIPVIVPRFGKLIYRSNPNYLDSLLLVLESYRYEKRNNHPCPVFIKRAHLERRSFWPHWEFSIIVMLRPGKLEIDITKSKRLGNPSRWIMAVDLADESFGIYNNAGKRFLREKYRTASAHAAMSRLSDRFFEVLDPKTEPGTSLQWGQVGETLPLRWVSGGFLPIVRFRNDYWAMLFFRDIQPIGLNLAIGASESKFEYKNLHKLIGREFSEETVLLVSEPRAGGSVSQERFTVEQFSFENPEPISEYINPDFVKEHNRLRKLHDDIQIEVLRNADGRPIMPIRTPFRVKLSYHSPDLRAVDEKYFKNVLFTLNPFEFGIEIIWICKFEMNEGEYILGGEYDLGRDYLVREPIMLLSMDFLRQIYGDTGSLGERIDGTDSKMLPPIPENYFVAFNQDFHLGKRRLDYLNGLIKSTPNHGSISDNLIHERDRLEKWISDYFAPFTALATGGNLTFEAFRTLCPVTWKSLELIFSHKIDYKG